MAHLFSQVCSKNFCNLHSNDHIYNASRILVILESCSNSVKLVSFLNDCEFCHVLLTKKPKITLTEKYDVSHKILNELTNLESRHILFAIMKRSKSVKAISREQKIPQSSVYKRIQSLKKCSLIHEKTGFSKSGHIERLYQSRIKNIEINITRFEPKITFTKNELIKKELF